MKNTHARLSCALGALGALVCLLACAGGCKPVYTSIKAGATGAMRVDGSGAFHVAYSLNTVAERGRAASGVYYATGTPGGAWAVETVYDAKGASVEVDTVGLAPDGTAHVLYRSGRSSSHAWRTGEEAWAAESFVDNDTGPIGAMAFDGDGGMHVSYSIYATDTFMFDNLRPAYAYKPAGGAFSCWQVSTGGGWADVNYGGESSIAVDGSGTAHIVFGSAGNPFLLVPARLWYARAAAGGSAPGTATQLSGSATGSAGNDLVIDGDGALHVIWSGYDSSTPQPRYIASDDGGDNWTAAVTVDASDNCGMEPRMALQAGGALHAAYLVQQAPGSTAVGYAAKPAGGAWAAETLDITALALLGIGVDGAGAPAVLYARDTGDGEAGQYCELIVYYRGAGGDWTAQVIKDATVPKKKWRLFGR